MTADALQRRVALLSPVALVGMGFGLARLTTAIWDVWSWIPVLIYYWGSLIILITWSGGPEAIRRWLGPSRTDRWIWLWRVLALAVPALFFPTAFLSSLAAMDGWWVPVLWFGLGAVNAWIEEGYWRGLLLDAASGWPGWQAALYSAACFGASHPLLFGWQRGDALNGIAGFLGTLLAGLIWGLVYRQTRSLRLPILGHFVQQMLAPPYHVFSQLIAIFK